MWGVAWIEGSHKHVGLCLDCTLGEVDDPSQVVKVTLLGSSEHLQSEDLGMGQGCQTPDQTAGLELDAMGELGMEWGLVIIGGHVITRWDSPIIRLGEVCLKWFTGQCRSIL